MQVKHMVKKMGECNQCPDVVLSGFAMLLCIFAVMGMTSI